MSWPLRPIWGVWKHSQWISHTPKKTRDRHQNQVSSMLRTKVTDWSFYLILTEPKWQFWQLRPIWGVWKRSQWISHTQKPRDRHQNQVSSMSRTKLIDLAILPYFDWPQNGHFGHSGQSEVSENGPNAFPMPKNLGIGIKIKSLACTEPKLQNSPFISQGAFYSKIGKSELALDRS